MSSETEKWFLSEVLRWREFGASAWCVMLNTALCWILVLTLLIIEHLGDPKLILVDSIGSFMSPSSWPYLVTGTMCVVQLCRLTSSNSKAVPSVTRSVISCIKNALSKDLASFLQFVIIGGVLSIVLVRQVGSSLADFYVTLDNKRSLNMSIVCLFLAGGYSGLQGAWDYHFKNGNFLKIEIINLDKYSLVKHKLQSECLPVLIRSLFMLLRFALGFCTGSLVLGFLSIHDVYEELLRVRLICCTYLVILYVTSVLLCVRVCIAAHLVSPLQQLPLENLLDGAASSSSILSLLSLQSLSDATEESSVLREIFSLSIPGGHPHTWNKLLSVTLKTLQDMISDLNKLISPPKDKEEEEKSFPSANSSFARTITSPNMRSLAPRSDREKSCTNSPAAPQPPKWVQTLTDNWNTFVAGLSRRPVIAWLVNEPQDVKFREVFTRSQAAIYSAEVLSHVVRASILEDSYGVVQKDLPSILTALLRLEELVDRCRGQASFHRKRSSDPADVQLKLELKCAAKSAVYRIVIAFREHILVVPLEADLAKKIRSCHNFLEA